MTRSQKGIVNFEVGGQDIDWHATFTAGTHGSWMDPPEPDELTVERAELLVGIVDGKPQRIDILDLILEVGGGDLPAHIEDELIAQLGERP